MKGHCDACGKVDKLISKTSDGGYYRICSGCNSKRGRKK